MLKNEDIICLSSIDWDFIWQGHQEIMTKLARSGNRVLFIENTGVRIPTFKDLGRIKNRIYNWRKGIHGIRKIEDGLYVYSPIILPFPYLKIARFINKKLISSILLKWLKAVGFAEPIVWVFLPTGLSLDIIDEVESKVLIYYCIDSFQDSSRDARKVGHTERIILQKADLVFATSEKLLNHCAQYNKNIHYFPFGVNIDNFMDALDNARAIPADLQKIKRPIAGYIGGIHRWIDFDLVHHAASENRDVSFVFCGPIQADVSKVKDMPNVLFLGQKGPDELPAYVREFDVTLIPYRITEYTRNVYPTKLNEYLSMGKPVVSTPLPEITKFNKENRDIVKIASTKEAFARYIKELVRQAISPEEKVLAMDAAKKNSWSNKIEEMSLLIEKTAYKKVKEKEVSWRYNLSRFYKKTRKKLAPAVFLLAFCYMILFHTPLIWFFAKPLQVTSIPEQADAIMVLGGGVGESGKVGQGYEERVDSAVKLYKRGLADKIVYSTGYKYIMKEAEVMKALSVFMGVREDDILLDDTPINTYDMVMNLKALIKKNRWRGVILISSAYHMRRLSLLCDKQLKDTRIYFLPVQQSSFYSHAYGAQLYQIKGILQEYLAILYYKLKGYL